MEKVWSFLKISNKAFSHVGNGKPPWLQISYGVLIVAGKKSIGILPLGSWKLPQLLRGETP